MLVVMKSCVSQGFSPSVRRNFKSVGLPNLEESFSGMATRCQGLFLPARSSPRLCFGSTGEWLAICRCHSSKRKKNGLDEECALFFDDGIKVEMVMSRY